MALLGRHNLDTTRGADEPTTSEWPVTYVDLRGGAVRPVRVHVDDQWRDGQPEAYRRDRDGTWRGFVRWSEGVGMTRIAWLDERWLRPADDRRADARWNL